MIDLGAGPRVLLLHGQPGSGEDWLAVAERLAPSHRVLAPDRPGWGSSTLEATSLAGNAAALAGLLGDDPAELPTTVAAHSLGGGVALELALRYPDKVGALVLVGSVGVGAALTGLDRVLALPVVGEGIVRAGVAVILQALAAGSRLSDRHAPGRATRRLRDLPTVRAAAGEGGKPLVGRSRRSFIAEQRALVAETPGLERRLARISVPVAVVAGTFDRVIPLAAARELAGAIPGAELVVVRGGHMLPIDHADEIASVVERYAAMAVLPPRDSRDAGGAGPDQGRPDQNRPGQVLPT